MSGLTPPPPQIKDINVGVPEDSIPEGKLAINEAAFYKLQLKDYEQDIAAKKEYAQKIFNLVLGWLIFIGVIVFLNGFFPFFYKLSDKVLIVLISTTTINIISILIIIMKYIFRTT